MWNPNVCQDAPNQGQDDLVLLRHRSRFWPQNYLERANTIKNGLVLNMRKSEKNETITSNDLWRPVKSLLVIVSFFSLSRILHFLLIFINQNGCVRIKKLIKTLMEICDFDKKPNF